MVGLTESSTLLLRTPAAVWEKPAPLDLPFPTTQTHKKKEKGTWLLTKKPSNLSSYKRNVIATNPRNGPFPTVFPHDGHKLQNGLFGDCVNYLLTFGIYFPSVRQWHVAIRHLQNKTSKCTKLPENCLFLFWIIVFAPKHNNNLSLTRIWIIKKCRAEQFTWWRWDLLHDWVPIGQVNLYQSHLCVHEDF